MLMSTAETRFDLQLIQNLMKVIGYDDKNCAHSRKILMFKTVMSIRSCLF